MREAIIAFTLACALSLAVRASAADWPRFLGPTGNGVSADKGINKNWAEKPPKELWRVALGDSGFAGPSVAKGRVYIIDHKGDKDLVRVLDLKNGTDLWTPYSYQDSDRQSDGWGYSQSTPTVDNGRVYTLGRLGTLNCFDAASGKLLWTRNIIADFKGRLPGWNLAASPYIDGNKLIVCPGGPDAAVAALDKMTGVTLWKGGGSDNGGYATPVAVTLNGKKQYLIFTSANVMGVDVNDGTQLWKFPWVTGANVNASTPIAIGNSVFITSAYGHGAAFLDVALDGVTQRWMKREIQSRFTTPLLLNGMLYTTTDNNNLVCFDPQTGEIKWKQPGFEWGGLVYVDGVVIVADGAKGDVVMFNPTPDGYQELGRIKPLGGRSWTAPIVADGKLLVRNQQALVCLDLK